MLLTNAAFNLCFRVRLKAGNFYLPLRRSLELAIDLKDRLKIIHIEASQIVEYKQVESKKTRLKVIMFLVGS